MSKMRVLRAIALLVVSATVGASPAAAAPGAPVRGAMSGSGSSTLGFVAGHPYRLSESDGTFRSTFLGRGTYHLQATDTGTRKGIALTIKTKAGTLAVSASSFGWSLFDTPLPVTGGTGRFAHASGSVTIVGYAKSSVECLPPPMPGVPPDLFCTWQESATLTGAIVPH